MEDCVDMNVESPGPGFLAHFQKTARRRTSGTVQQHVDRTQDVYGSLDGAARFGWDCEITRDQDTPAPERLDFLDDGPRLAGIGATSRDRDVRSLLGEFQRGGRANASGAAGYETAFSVQLHC
jgi:hypothetical protein